MVNFNGNLIADSEPLLSPYNRGLKYGDGVFETLRYVNGILFFWEDHYFRLMASMRMLRMEIPMNFTPEFLEGEIKRTIAENELESASVRARLTVFRKIGGNYTPATNAVDYLIEVKALEAPFYTIPEGNYEVELFKDYWVNKDMLSQLKTTNKILNVIAGVYAKENGYENCLLLNGEKHVVEAINGNVFLVQGQTVKTPPLSEGCLNGILRKKLIAIISNLPDVELVEALINPFELQKSDELWITNAIQGIIPVTKYRKKQYANTLAKNVLGKLNAQARLQSTN
ncbi:MAG: aminotransferase class IV [Bacteroidota bacterium]